MSAVATPPAPSKAEGSVTKPKWVKIYGRTVDVSKFRHPGGNIIEFFYGMDGTTAFEAFHGHSKGAFKMLRGLKIIFFQGKKHHFVFSKKNRIIVS